MTLAEKRRVNLRRNQWRPSNHLAELFNYEPITTSLNKFIKFLSETKFKKKFIRIIDFDLSCLRNDILVRKPLIKK